MIFIIFLFLRLSEGLLSFATLGTVLAAKGSTRNITCSSTTVSHWKWVFNNQVLVDSATCQLIAGTLSSKYSLENNGNECNLIIKNISFRDAGTYTCSDTEYPKNSEQATMHLLVLDSLSCSQDSRNSLVVFNSSLTIKCLLAYNASNVVSHPKLRWLDDLPDTTSSQTHQNQTFYLEIETSILISNISLKNSIILKPYVCKMSFNNLIIPKDIKDSCSTPLLSVSRPPQEMAIITPRGNNEVDVGESIVCLSHSNPASSYTWVFLEEDQGISKIEEWKKSVKNKDPNAKPYVGKVISDEQTVVVNKTGIYGCLASSTYGNGIYNASTFVLIKTENGLSKTSLVLSTFFLTILFILLIYFICFVVCTDFINAIFV